MEDFDIKKNDQMIFTGDMEDRGPHTQEVFKKIKWLLDKYPKNITWLMGNHDLFNLSLQTRPGHHFNQYVNIKDVQSFWSSKDDSSSSSMSSSS